MRYKYLRRILSSTSQYRKNCLKLKIVWCLKFWSFCWKYNKSRDLDEIVVATLILRHKKIRQQLKTLQRVKMFLWNANGNNVEFYFHNFLSWVRWKHLKEDYVYMRGRFRSKRTENNIYVEYHKITKWFFRKKFIIQVTKNLMISYKSWIGL